MSDAVRINGTATREYTADLEAFYRDYWHVGGEVAPVADAAREELVQALFGQWPTGLRVLEVGPGGEGGLIRLLRPHGNDVHGIDVSASAIACCQQWGLDVRRCLVGGEPIPYSDDTFDVVLAFEVCEHFANPQYAIEEIRRVLTPGGRFIASTPNPLIAHWPRYFYPSLIEREHFREFLQVNQLAVVREITAGSNRFERVVGPARAGWSWIWDCLSITADGVALRDTAHAFWRRTDGDGIRQRPIETADLARAALALAPADVDALGLLAAASVYRVLNGEAVECQEAISRLVNVCSGDPGPEVTRARYWLLIVDAELRRFNQGMLDIGQRQVLIEATRAADPGLAHAIDEADDAATRLSGLTA